MGCPQSILARYSGQTAPFPSAVQLISVQDNGEKKSPSQAPRVHHSAQFPQTPTNRKPLEEIAVVGIGCRTAGADNIRDYWRVLVNGECHVSDVPADRWRASAFLDSDRMAHNKAYVQKAAFIYDINGFDNHLFGISDFEARSMDHQQCFMLDCTMMALEDAGITRAQIAGTNTGVFVGSMNNDFGAGYAGMTSKVDGYTTINVSASIYANRVSHVFDLKGPSLVVDTACSASLVAVHLGAQSIITGDSDMAICGGVCIMTLPDLFVHLSKAGMISPTGLCHTFSDKADGYTRGEGCGVIILKRLTDALRDGNKVWATISTGANQDGRAEKLLTTPSGEQQKKLLATVYSKFDINVDDLEYIEAHGTGTPAGDPVEVNALGSFFKERSTQPRDRYIGSVKTNIGHTESAAGILSLIKVLLMMKHGKIVPSLHCETVNPKIDLDDIRFTIPKHVIPWETPDKVAACNSFGFGGTNCHAVLKTFSCQRGDKPVHSLSRHMPLQSPIPSSGIVEKESTSFHGTPATGHNKSDIQLTQQSLHQFPQPETPQTQNAPNVSAKSKCHIICFSNKTSKGLKNSLHDLLTDDETVRLDVHAVSCTSTLRRDHYQHRAAFVVDDMHDLQTQAEKRVSELRDSATPKAKAEVAFVFCGMVPLWKGMCEELLGEYQVFSDTMRRIDDELSALNVPWSLSKKLREEDPSQDSILAPIAIFAVQVCLVELWRSFGVQPSCIVGQSIGEVAAAYTAGCLTLPEAVKVVYERSRLLDTVKGGSMFLLVDVDVENVRKILQTLQGKATIALEYSPRSCTISADKDLEPVLQRELNAQNIRFRSLNLPVAYHSHHVDPCLKTFKGSIADIAPGLPQTPFISTVTGSAVKFPPDSQYWVDNMRSPVLFGKAIKKVPQEERKGTTLFLEIGPRPVLESHMKDIFPDGDNKVVSVPSVNGPKESEIKSLTKAVGVLYEQNISIKFEGFVEQTSALTNIPRYAFNRKNLKTKTETNLILEIGNDLYEGGHRYVKPVRATKGCGFNLIITPLAIASLYDHVISGRVIIPGAFYVEAAFAIAHHREMRSPVRVTAEFVHPVSVEKNEVTFLQAELTTDQHNSGISKIVVQKGGKKVATLSIQQDISSSHRIVNMDHIRSKCKEKIQKDDIYSALRKAGFEYGESFSLLNGACSNSFECLAELKVNEVVHREMQTTYIHPAILDCVWQSSQVLMKKNMEEGLNVLPKSMGKLVVYSQMEPTMYIHTRLKNQNSYSFSIDQLLLTPSGDVIGEVVDFVVQVLSPSKNSLVPDLIDEEWTKVEDWNRLHVVKGRDLVIISDSQNLLESTNDVNYLFQNLFGSPDFEASVEKCLCSTENTSAMCLVFSERFKDEMDGGEMQSRLIKVYSLIQTILRVLNERKSEKHLYLCTVNAWPSQTPGDVHEDANPAATSVWGLFRTVAAEHIYPYISMVDLQVDQTLLTSDTLRTLLGTLNADTDLRAHTEIMLTSEAVLINAVCRVPNGIMIPAHRNKQQSHAGDKLPAGSVILSKEAAAISDPVAIMQKPTRQTDSTTTKKIKLLTFTQPARELVSLTVTSNSQGIQEHVPTHNFTVTALELRGHAVDGAREEMISCCPTTVGPEVTVHAGTVLDGRAIPDYQPGDLTALVLLWQFYKKMKTKTVTVLASQSTNYIAESLKVLCAGKHVNICTIDNVETIQDFGGTLVSLVLLDSDIISSVSRFWEEAEYLVACASLVTPDARSALACTMPDVQLCLIDTQQLFQSQKLRKVVPQIKLWIESNKPKLAILQSALRAKSSTCNTTDTNQLLQFRCLEMADLSVAFLEDKLFRKDSCYIVVGGLTGLGWLCVEFMAEYGAGYIAILNRSAPSDDRKTDMANIGHEHQCSIQAFQADIISTQSLVDTLHTIQQTSGRELRGIFTGAAVLADAKFNDLGSSEFEKVMSPKVLGTWNLHKLTKDMPLDYFVMHSSVASVLGNPGQANYSAANAFQDGLAYHRRHLGLAAQTINWGPLDTGMLENKVQVKDLLTSLGFSITAEKEVKTNLKTILLLNWTRSVPVTINFDRLAKKLFRTEQAVKMSRLHKVVSEKKRAGALISTSGPDVSRIKYMKEEDQLEAYENYVAYLVSQLLPDLSSIARDQDLFDLGFTSIDGMELMNQVLRDTSISLAPVDVFTGGATITSLATVIQQQIRASR